MCIKVPESIKDFSEKHFAHLGIRKRRLLPIFIASMAFSTGKRTLTALGGTVYTEPVFKTNVSKFFRRKRLRTRNMHRRLIENVIEEYIERYGKTGTWALLIDGTSTRRGGFTKIQNAVQYRKKSRSSKGVSTKAHTFLMGLLIFPDGMRLPFTRYTCYTKKYCRTHNKKHQTQNVLAAKMIAELRSYLPEKIQPVIIADAFFDTATTRKACDDNNAVFITTADSARILILPNGCKQKLHNRGKRKIREDYRPFKLIKGAEPYTLAHSRYSHPELKRKMKHVYRVTGETLNVSGLGDTRVVFSWKKKSGRGNSGESFRVLLCSDTSWSDEKIVEFYALRWQIEVFFRELKSDLGLEDFSGQDFQAFERFVDLCLVTYFYLESERIRQMKTTRSRKEKGKIKVMRTSCVIKLLRIQEKEEVMALMKRKICRNKAA